MSIAPLMKVIRSLHFQQDRRAELNSVSPDQWPALLKQTDHFQLTLPLGIRCRDYLPDIVRSRDRAESGVECGAPSITGCRISAHLPKLSARVPSISSCSKGHLRLPLFYVPNADYRPQSDIDLYCPPDAVASARDALSSIGFLSLQAAGAKYSDHLPPMIRNLDWKWRGDYYASDLPLTVELHFRFWDTQTEKLPVPCVEDFWQRRCNRIIGDAEIPMLSPADTISYSALHLIRHLLRGDVRIYHAYEIAHFLHQTEHDDKLWTEWSAGRAQTSSALEAVAFRLVTAWFGCRTHPVVDEQMKRLPARTARWFDLFSHSPLDFENAPTKTSYFSISVCSTIRRIGVPSWFAVCCRNLLKSTPSRVRPMQSAPFALP